MTAYSQLRIILSCQFIVSNFQQYHIAEFDEVLVKNLLKKVTVYDDYMEFRFKSDVTVSVKK